MCTLHILSHYTITITITIAITIIRPEILLSSMMLNMKLPSHVTCDKSQNSWIWLGRNLSFMQLSILTYSWTLGAQFAQFAQFAHCWTLSNITSQCQVWERVEKCQMFYDKRKTLECPFNLIKSVLFPTYIGDKQDWKEIELFGQTFLPCPNLEIMKVKSVR